MTSVREQHKYKYQASQIKHIRRETFFWSETVRLLSYAQFIPNKLINDFKLHIISICFVEENKQNPDHSPNPN